MFVKIYDIIKYNHKSWYQSSHALWILLKYFSTFPEGVLVVEENGEVTGFTVIEILEKNKTPKGFSDLKIDKPLERTWANIIMFTTKTNFLDIEEDSQLLRKAEEIMRHLL